MTARRWRHLALFTAAAGIVAMAACTLNPQPLPPAAAESGGFEDGGRVATPPADASATNAPATPTPFAEDGGLPEAGTAANSADAGDAGDAGDADVEDADAGHS